MHAILSFIEFFLFEGDRGTSFYYILSGAVYVIIRDLDINKKQVPTNASGIVHAKMFLWIHVCSPSISLCFYHNQINRMPGADGGAPPSEPVGAWQ